jgi:hypothetical protein
MGGESSINDALGDEAGEAGQWYGPEATEAQSEKDGSSYPIPNAFKP